MATKKTPTTLTTSEHAQAEEEAKIDAAVQKALKAAGKLVDYANFRCMGCWINAVQAPAGSDWRMVSCQSCSEHGNNFYNSPDLLVTRRLGSIGSQFVPNLAARMAKISGFSIEQLLSYGDNEVVTVDELASFFDQAVVGYGIKRPRTAAEKALAAKVQEQQMQRDRLRAKRSRLDAITKQLEVLTNDHATLKDEIEDMVSALEEDGAL